MTTPATETRPRPAQGQGGMQKKTAGLPRWGWIAIAAAGAIVAFVWWRSRSSSSSAATAGQCYDASGNAVPCPGVDNTSVLQTENMALLAALLNNQGAKSTGGTSSSSDTAVTDKETLLQIAKEAGLTEAQLVALNPNLLQYDKPNTEVPAGITITTGPAPANAPPLPSPGTGSFTPAPAPKPKPKPKKKG